MAIPAACGADRSAKSQPPLCDLKTFNARHLGRPRVMGYGCAIVNTVADMWNGMPGMAQSASARAANFIIGTTLRLDDGTPNVRPSMNLAPRAAGVVAPAFNGFHLAETPKILQD